VYAVLAVVTFLLWRRHRSEPAAWAAATFGSLFLVVIAAAAYGPNPKNIPDWFVKLLIAVIVLFPYLLFRFSAAFIAPSRRLVQVATAAVGLVIVWTVLLPHFPKQGTPLHGQLFAYLLARVVLWTSLSLPIGVLLYRRGRGQPTLPRRRVGLVALP